MTDTTLLNSPDDEAYPTIERLPSAYNPLRKFHLTGADQKHYQQQYGDMYFVRLAQLKPAVEQAGAEAWADFEIGGEQVQKKDRVLDVRQGELCWVVGTIYMDMPLKPNILDDIAKDYSISVPPPREKYVSPTGQDLTMLEDESGRLRLVGTPLQTLMLVTGCIVAVMGTENSKGEFEIIDLKVADLPRQPQRWERDDGEAAVANGGSSKRKRTSNHNQHTGGKVAIVSGLGISGDEADSLSLDLLMEYLSGEAGAAPEQAEASRISRLIIAGNSIEDISHHLAREELAGRKASKKYGYDAASYNPAPTTHLDNFLSTLLPTMPITLMPGQSDPANITLPQQPIHPAMLPHSRAYASPPNSAETGWLDSTTNPWEADVDGWRLLGNSGQPVDDIFKYIEGDNRLDMMENMLRWRDGAPTAPDTLWCYPYQDEEPFIVEETPHVFFVGNQPRFETALIEGPLDQTVRLICVPRFKDTGEFLLLDMDNLEVEVVKIELVEEP